MNHDDRWWYSLLYALQSSLPECLLDSGCEVSRFSGKFEIYPRFPLDHMGILRRNGLMNEYGWSTNPPTIPPLRNMGLIAGLLKGNQWLIKPYFREGGVGWLANATITPGISSGRKPFCPPPFPPGSGWRLMGCAVAIIIPRSHWSVQYWNRDQDTIIPKKQLKESWVGGVLS